MPLNALHSFAALLKGRFLATRCAHVAGSLAFTTLLAIVPLITVSIALFSRFPAFDSLAEALSGFLQKDILPELAAQIVTTYALQFSDKAGELTLIGTLLLIVTVLLLLNTIDGVFNAIWGVRKPRPLLTRFAVYWVVITLGPIAIAGSIFATGKLVSSSIAYVGEIDEFGALAATLVPLALLGTLFSFLYLGAPNHPVRLRHALIGGFSAAIAFLLMQRLFGLFIALFPTYTLVYGTFAALPIFLVWLYLSWVTILLGAILAATLPEFEERRALSAPFPGSRALGALNILVALAEAQLEGRTATFDSVQKRSGCGHRETEALLGEMREAGWVAHTEDETWVLTRLPESLSLFDVIERFALSVQSWEQATHGTTQEQLAHRLLGALRAADLSLAELSASDESGPAQLG